MSSWTIYWITRLDPVRIGLAATIALLAFLSLAHAMSYLDGGAARSRRNAVSFAGASLALMAVAALTPTTKEMCAIIAIPAIVNSEDAQEISSEVVDLAKDWLKELKPKEGE